MGHRLLKHSFSLLHVDYVKLGTNWNYRNVISPYYRIYYIDEGRGVLSSPGESLILEPNFLYLIPSFTLCNLHCDKYLRQYFIQFFEESSHGMSLFANHRQIMKRPANDVDIANVKRIHAINPGRGINRSDNPKVYEKDAYYKEYQALNDAQNIATYYETQGIIMQLTARFMTSASQSATGLQPIHSKILDIVAYIEINLSKELSVTQLAARATLHKDYFSRLFLQYTGVRPIEYVHNKRVERAQYLMATTTLSFADIAQETGLKSVPYLSKVFKTVTGMTPGEYRAQNASII